MAKLTVKTGVPLEAQDTWDKASYLPDFDKWLVVHDGWRSELPGELTSGTVITSVVTVKGLRNRVTWTIKEYDAPRRLVLKGDGKGGVKLGLVLEVESSGGSSVVAFTIELGGAPLFGPIGSGVARALKGDIEKSLSTFVELYS